MKKLSLNGIWKMTKKSSNKTYNAKIPGSVYSTLLDNNVIDDPFYRDNEKEITKLSNDDYTFTRNFNINSDFYSSNQVKLICKGLDTLASVKINNNPIFETSNMHVCYENDVKDFLMQGENTITIQFSSPIKYIEKKDKDYKLYSVDESHAIQGYGHIRKAHCMFGWDWGPKLPDMGIWRDIYLQTIDEPKINNIQFIQNHKEDSVSVNIIPDIEENININYTLSLTITDPKGNKEKYEYEKGIKNASVLIKSPQLWWPNNMGKQNLYNFDFEIISNGNVVDTSSYKIGLRTLNVIRKKDEWGTSFYFEINKCPLFIMGANYIPEDSIFNRINYDKTKKIMDSCSSANFNCIRVWGGGYYPDDYFYDLCDEYGFIVWQDLMYACATYKLTDEFEENIKLETRQNIKRIRHHACLGIICGNNEMEDGWLSWDFEDEIDKPKKQKADYIKQFEYVLQKEVENLTDILYWPSSPSSFGSFDEPGSPDHGDVHDWTVWHKKAPFSYYRTTSPRFLSEFGMQSFPSIETVDSFTIKEDYNLFSKVMENHQKNSSGNTLIMNYISQNYKYPHGFDNLLYISQLNQAEAIKYACEHYRRIRPRCMGTIYWQLNDCWPVASWSSIDYYGRWKALHYFAKKFFNPILCSVCEDSNSASIHIDNNTKDSFVGELNYSLKKLNSEILYNNSINVKINSFTSQKIIEEDFSDILTSNSSEEIYLSYELKSNDDIISENTVIFTKIKYLQLKKPKFTLDLNIINNKYYLTIKSSEFAKNVEIKLPENKTIFSDNFFDLEKNIEKTISFSHRDKIDISDFSIRSVYDTYEK